VFNSTALNSTELSIVFYQVATETSGKSLMHIFNEETTQNIQYFSIFAEIVSFEIKKNIEIENAVTVSSIRRMAVCATRCTMFYVM